MVCCKSNSSKTTNHRIQLITSLSNKAEDEKYSFEERLVFATSADSLAFLTDNCSIQLETKRTLAGVNLLLGNLPAAEIGFLKVADIASSLSDFENLGIAYNDLAIIYDKRGEYDSALKYYRIGIQNFSKVNNNLQIARATVNIGIVLLNQENYEESYLVSQDALKMLSDLQADAEKAASYVTIGLVLSEQNSLDGSLQYFQKAKDFFKKAKNPSGVASVFTNVGDVYLKKEEYQNALHYYRESLRIKDSLGLLNTGAVLEDFAEVYTSLSVLDSAEEYCMKALIVQQSNKDKEGLLVSSNQLSKIYLKENNLFKTLTQALNTQNQFPKSGFLKQKLENNIILYEVFAKLKQSDSAIKYVNIVLSLKDSVYNADRAANVAKMDAKYRNQEIKKELLLSQQLQKLQAAQINTQRNSIFILSIFLFLLVTLSILLFRLYKAIKRAKKRIETLMKELNHRVKNNLQIISDMLSFQLDIAKDQEQADLIQSSIHRVQSMNAIHTLLYQKGFTGMINMGDFMKTLLLKITDAYRIKSNLFEIEINVSDFFLSIDKAIPTGLITNELVTNIFKYSKAIEMRCLKINLSENNENCILEVVDNCGYWDVDYAKAKRIGLGLFLVETFVKQLHGSWNAVSDNLGSIHFIEFRK